MSTGCQIGGNDSLLEGRQTNYPMLYTLLTHDSVVLLINYDVITIITVPRSRQTPYRGDRTFMSHKV